MTAARQRKIQRAVHLLLGVILLAYVYLPTGEALEDLVQIMVFPILALSGIAMWQAPRLRRLRRRARRPDSRIVQGERLVYRDEADRDGRPRPIRGAVAAPHHPRRPDQHVQCRARRRPPLLEAWSDDARFMRARPGFISTQLHRGTAGSCTFVNLAVWESTQALNDAFQTHEFQLRIGRYPASATSVPHIFEKLAVPGICVA